MVAEPRPAPSRDPDVYIRPGAASIRPAALYDAIYELALGGGGGGGGLTEAEVQALIDASLVDYQALAQEGQPNGYAPLDPNGLIPNAHLPALAITSTYVCASQAEMLALPAQTGDVAVRTDLNVTFILAQEPPSTAANWQQILAPTGGGGSVISVNGYTGVVNLVAADVGALTQSQADARYSLTSHLHAGVYATPTDVSTAVSNHAAAADPHTGYLLESAAATSYLPIGGGTLTGPLTVTGNLAPEATSTRTLGTVSFRWANTFTNVLTTSATGATTGALRLGNNQTIGWRNQANSADLFLVVDATNALLFGGNPVLTQPLGDARYSLAGHNHAGVYATPSDVSQAIATHEAAADPHSTYLNQSRGDARYSLLAHTHAGVYATPADVTNAITAHAGAADPHTGYLLETAAATTYLTQASATATYLPLAGGAVTGPLTVQGLAVKLDPAPDNTLTWTAAGLKSVASGSGTPEDIATLHREEFEGPTGTTVTLAGVPDTLLTVARNGVEQANGGLHFSQAGAVLTFSDAFTAGERVVVTYAAGSAVALQTAATDVIMSGDNVIGVTEAPAETFALAFKRSATAGNALSVNADGLYAPTPDLSGYSLTSHNHNSAYEPIDSAYTKAESDGKYSLGTHNHDAAYAASGHNHDAAYLALAGGTVTGATTFNTRLTVAGVAQPRISVQSSAPSSPATGDIWIW